MALMSKSAFGSKDNIETAKSSGTINQYDILYLDTKEVGWIDRNGNTIISTTRTQEDIEVNGVDGLSIANGEKIPAGISFDEFVKLIVQKEIPADYKHPTLTFVDNSGNLTKEVESGTSLAPCLVAIFNQNDAGDLISMSIFKNDDIIS